MPEPHAAQQHVQKEEAELSTRASLDNILPEYTSLNTQLGQDALCIICKNNMTSTRVLVQELGHENDAELKEVLSELQEDGLIDHADLPHDSDNPNADPVYFATAKGIVVCNRVKTTEHLS